MMMVAQLVLGLALLPWAMSLGEDRVVRMDLKRDLPLRRRLDSAANATTAPFLKNQVPLGVGAGYRRSAMAYCSCIILPL